GRRPMDRWYYAHGNQRMGPILSAELRQLCSKGQLSPTDMVLKEGSQHWTAVATVPELLPKPNDPAIAIRSPATDHPSKKVALASVAIGFDVASVRCAVETRLAELIQKDERLNERLKAMAKEREQARIQTLVRLMTESYRVDEAITPKLARLGA